MYDTKHNTPHPNTSTKPTKRNRDSEKTILCCIDGDGCCGSIIPDKTDGSPFFRNSLLSADDDCFEIGQILRIRTEIRIWEGSVGVLLRLASRTAVGGHGSICTMCTCSVVIMYTLATLCTNVICSAGENPAGVNGIKTKKSSTDTILCLACNRRSGTASMSANVPKWVTFTAQEQLPTAPATTCDAAGVAVWYCNKNGTQKSTNLGLFPEPVALSTLRTCMP